MCQNHPAAVKEAVRTKNRVPATLKQCLGVTTTDKKPVAWFSHVIPACYYDKLKHTDNDSDEEEEEKKPKATKKRKKAAVADEEEEEAVVADEEEEPRKQIPKKKQKVQEKEHVIETWDPSTAVNPTRPGTWGRICPKNYTPAEQRQEAKQENKLYNPQKILLDPNEMTVVYTRAATEVLVRLTSKDAKVCAKLREIQTKVALHINYDEQHYNLSEDENAWLLFGYLMFSQEGYTQFGMKMLQRPSPPHGGKHPSKHPPKSAKSLPPPTTKKQTATQPDSEHPSHPIHQKKSTVPLPLSSSTSAASVSDTESSASSDDDDED